MSNGLTSKKLATIALTLSLTAIASAQSTSSETSGTGSEVIGSEGATSRSSTGPNDFGATGTATSSMPTTTGAGGNVESGTTFPEPTSSPTPTPGFYNQPGVDSPVGSGTTIDSTTSSNPAFDINSGIPAGTGKAGTGPNAPTDSAE